VGYVVGSEFGMQLLLGLADLYCCGCSLLDLSSSEQISRFASSFCCFHLLSFRSIWYHSKL
jgi:hypothetical protein